MTEAAGSLGGWLALREPADAAARSTAVTASVVRALPKHDRIRAVDLGSGTGANIRYLSAHMPAGVEWLAVDRDPVLLAQAPLGVHALQCELGDLDDPAIFEGRQLVTASALLDLVSRAWIDRLAVHCRRAGATVLFALSYDGRSTCDPLEPEDDLVLTLFNRHQRANQKGFGTAAGPDATHFTARAFADAGYELHVERSDWNIPPGMRELQRLLIEGWAQAAAEIAPDRAALIDGWLDRRLAHVEAGCSRIVVGHVDIGGWPVR